MNTALHFSSKTDQWATPKALFDELDKEFNFETDVCASVENSKCIKFFDENEDGLKQEWAGSCYMNPPYGKTIKDWVAKAYLSSVNNGATVVCLLPARTDTKWFHDFCIRGEVRFLKGRIKFGDAKCGAPFPSMIVIFKPKPAQNCAIARF